MTRACCIAASAPRRGQLRVVSAAGPTELPAHQVTSDFCEPLRQRDIGLSQTRHVSCPRQNTHSCNRKEPWRHIGGEDPMRAEARNMYRSDAAEERFPRLAGVPTIPS
jgi:hypothetical protein